MEHRRARWYRWLAALGLTAAALLTVPSAPAVAGTSVGPAGSGVTNQITVVIDCESHHRTAYCWASISGAVGSTTIHWYYNGSYVPAYDQATFIQHGCPVPGSMSVQVYVTASNGTGVGSAGTSCRIDPM